MNIASNETNDYFFNSHENQRGYIIADQVLFFIPSNQKSNIDHSKKGYNNKIDNLTNQMIKVSDCYYELISVRLLPSAKNKRNFQIQLSILPTDKGRREKWLKSSYPEKKDLVIKVSVASNRLQFDEMQVVDFATSYKFHVYDKKHFCNALSSLINYELYEASHEYTAFFDVGHQAGTQFSMPYNTYEKLFLPDSDKENISFDTALTEVYTYIKKQPAASILLTYTFLSITFYFIEKYWDDNKKEFRRNFKTDFSLFSLNYYGNNILQVYQDVNLFSNMFNSDTPKTITRKENIILDSVTYDLDNHVRFKDIPLVVTSKHSVLSPSRKQLKEIITQKARGWIKFFPVIITSKPVKYAETICVTYYKETLCLPHDYKHLNKHIQTLYAYLIDYFNARKSNPVNFAADYMDNKNIEPYLGKADYYNAIAHMLMDLALDFIQTAFSDLVTGVHYMDFVQFLRNAVQTEMVNSSLISPCFGTLDEYSFEYSKKIIEFVKNTYCEHLNDKDPTIVWTEEFDDSTTSAFNPDMSKRYWVYIESTLLTDFIKKEILETYPIPMKKIKETLCASGNLRKNGGRYVYKRRINKIDYLYFCFFIRL